MDIAHYSFQNALQLTFDAIQPLPVEWVELPRLLGRVTAEDIYSLVDSPSVDSSLKDGYAVRSKDISSATPEHPARLEMVGQAVAGGDQVQEVRAGTAMRILSGAALPRSAEAVVAEEFTRIEGDRLIVIGNAEPGRNVLWRGSDVAVGQRLIPAGVVLHPARTGLLAASGHTGASVFQQPRVAIIATGDEVVAPGIPLGPGKLYASNLVTLAAWCMHYGMQVATQVVPDRPNAIEASLLSSLATHDALITSGGAWNGDRDLVVRVLDRLGWQKAYHRVRIGPGKAVGFGLLEGKPVFCLPGGPPSNYMAFLNLALPGLMKLAGFKQLGLPVIAARLSEDVYGQNDWTQFIQGRFEQQKGYTAFHPMKLSGRLQMMALAEGILTIPVGQDQITAGSSVPVKILSLPGHTEQPESLTLKGI